MSTPFYHLVLVVSSLGGLWRAISVGGHVYMPDLPVVHYKSLGDYNLGVLLPVYGYKSEGFCGDEIKDFTILQRIEAIRCAVEEVNRDDNLLPGVKLGFIMFDDCHKGITALAQTLHFIEGRGCQLEECRAQARDVCTNGTLATFDIVGLVGSENSRTTAQIANMLTSFRIPQVSYLATAESFTSGYRYPYFRRMLPPDTRQAAAIVSLLHHFQWTYASVVYSEGEYGNQGYKALQKEADKKGVCFVKAKEIPLSWGLGQFRRLILNLLLRENISIVVAFLSHEQAQILLDAADQMKVEGRITWIATDAWARNILDLGARRDMMLGSFSVQVNAPLVERFNIHYQNLAVGDSLNPWMNPFLQTFYNCTLEQSLERTYRRCDPHLRLHRHPRYMPDNSASLIYDTIYTYARALHAAISGGRCKGKSGSSEQLQCTSSELLHQLTNTSFLGEGGQRVTFRNGRRSVERSYAIYNIQNRTGSWVMERVADYNVSMARLEFTGRPIQWSRGKQPKSMCSKPCEKGHAQFVLGTMCCWMCQACAPNQYTRVLYGIQQCFACRPGTRPDAATGTICVPIIPDYIKWHQPISLLVCSAASLGLLSCGALCLLFIINNQRPLVKASSRELSYLLLASLVVSYSFCFSFLVKPSDSVCFVQLLGLSLCFTLMYGPLVIKTTRIYRIFEAGRMMNRRPACVTSKSQIGIVLGIELFHVCIIALWSVMVKPKVLELNTSDTAIELGCDFPTGPFITSLSYNAVLLVASVYCAFKTRKLPDNFSESRFIGFCVYSTVVIWLAFIPAYFTVPSPFYQTMLLCLAVLLNATLVQACIFYPKIYAIYRVKRSDQHLPPQRGAARFAPHPEPEATDPMRHFQVSTTNGNLLPIGVPRAATRERGDGRCMVSTPGEKKTNQVTTATTTETPIVGRPRSPCAEHKVDKVDVAQLDLDVLT